MMPRQYKPTGRRISPIDEVLDSGLPTSPASPPPTTPVDTVLGNGEKENPWINPFMEVYEATKAGSLQNLAEMQKQMEERFAHRGGYFGGKHAIAQGEMAAETGAFLDQLLAQTSLGASERQYQDWQRARGETMSLLNLLPILLGTQTTMPFIQQGQGIGGILGDLLGTGVGAFTGGFGSELGAGVGGK